MDAGLATRVTGSVIVAYLLGAVPWALIIGRLFYDVDVRTYGSGNLGATNVFRALGWKAGLAVFVLDLAKGAAAVALAEFLVPTALGVLAHEWTTIGATLAVMAGHSFSPYLGFRGGKSVAAAGGALLVLVPLAWPFLLLTWLLVFALTRIVSLGSVIVAAEFPVLVFVLYHGDWPLFGLSLIAACLVIWRHSANIARLIRGEEPRISLRRKPAAGGKDGL